MMSSAPFTSSYRIDPLVRDYLFNHPNTASWTSEKPSLQNLKQRADSKKFSNESRNVLVKVLREQYQTLPHSDKVEQNITSLLQSNTFTITTGHQLCLATGPLYFIYKILSAAKACELFNAEFPHVKAVPVFWMASEDHDADEISTVHCGAEKWTWNHHQSGAVGRFAPTNIPEWLEQWKHHIDSESFQLLSSAYRTSTLAEATRKLVHQLFHQYGVVVIDADHHELKMQLVPYMRSDVLQSVAWEFVRKQSDQLEEKGYKTQIHPRLVNLFFLEKGKRTRLEKNDRGFELSDGSRSFTLDEVLQLIEAQPESFSPNVVMRPLYQEVILPNLAYVGGPGEIAYWLQLKSYFDEEKVDFPQLILRDSVFLFTPKQAERLTKLGVSPRVLLLSKEEVVREWVEKAASKNFDEERNAIRMVFQQLKDAGIAVDKTLEASAGAEESKALAAIDQFEKKYLKAIKLKEETNINTLGRVWAELLPSGVWQERWENFFVLQHKLGQPLLPILWQHFQPFNSEVKFILVEAERD